MARKITRPYIELLESRRLLSIYADFNGDGRDDMAVGIPDEDLGTVADAGAVLVIYGTASGLNSTGSQVWTQDSPNVPDSGEAGDRFGSALAGGDFDNDGFTDLAIGVPGEGFGTAHDVGAVNIIYGSAAGLVASPIDKLWHQDTPRVREVNESGDRFGSALATGDFDTDGFVDLAVGVPSESAGSVAGAGALAVFYGTAVGITPDGNANFNLDTGNVAGTAHSFANFGFSLASGDFNNDGRDDLAIGVPFDVVNLQDEAGSVSVLYGSTNGIGGVGSQFWNQDSSGIAGGAEENDNFGWSVAAGDFNNDGRSDLAIGVPYENIGTFFIQEGFVHVLPGSSSGITATGSIGFDQSDVGGNVEQFDRFGQTLTTGDFNGDVRDDLAIGSPGETVGIGAGDDNGIVHVVFGGTGGISLSTSIEIKQESTGTGNQSEFLDNFGNALGAGDFNGNGKTDLAIAAPNKEVNSFGQAGRVFVLYGNNTTSFTGGQAWDEASPGIAGGAEDGDHFGGGLDAGGGRSTSGDHGKHDFAQLITADLELDSLVTKPNKRRFLSSRR